MTGAPPDDRRSTRFALPHCPECGGVTRIHRDEAEWDYAICVDDGCPRVVVTVISVPVRDRAKLPEPS